MPSVILLVEDAAQEHFLRAAIQRIASERQLEIAVQIRSSTGGSGKVLTELSSLSKEIQSGRLSSPDGIIVAVDANCKGFNYRRDEVYRFAGARLKSLLICAIPDPHIERWFLLDSEAFKETAGCGCKAPDYKCEKLRYKRLLNEAFVDAGIQPLLGGIEYAERLVSNLHFQRMARDPSFNHFFAEFRTWLNQFRAN